LQFSSREYREKERERERGREKGRKSARAQVYREWGRVWGREGMRRLHVRTMRREKREGEQRRRVLAK
jgi:hypothetical protein